VVTVEETTGVAEEVIKEIIEEAAITVMQRSLFHQSKNSQLLASILTLPTIITTTTVMAATTITAIEVEEVDNGEDIEVITEGEEDTVIIDL
jgi:hypothetical protein